MNNISLHDLREATPVKSYIDGPLALVLCRYLSPMVSLPSIKWGITPNTITLLMVVSGIIGGILFMIPYPILKYFSIPMFILWYIFDCADGEVARFTKQFSKYGKQMDWIAHLSCHSLLLIGIWLSFYQKGEENMYFISLMTLSCMSAELIGRNLIAFDSFLFDNKRFSEQEDQSFNLLRYVKIQICYFPNFVVFFPIFFFVDDIFNLCSIYYIYLIWGGLICIYGIKEYIRYTLYFYKN